MAILLLFIAIVDLFAKNDFYYGYIDDNKKQLPYDYKYNITQTDKSIDFIKKLIKKDKIYEAYSKIMLLKEKNKINILKPKIDILYAEILYKMDKKKYLFSGERVLEELISSVTIDENELLEALKILVDYKIKLGKIEEATYYANSITDSFKNPLSRAYGAIAISKIAISKKKYKKAKQELIKVLVDTNNLDVATLVADQLFDLYLKMGEKNKAKKLAKKVIDKNLDYYIKDNYKGFEKVIKLKKAGFTNLAIRVLEAMLYNAKDEKTILKYKLELAQLYMSIPTKDVFDLYVAKELLKDVVRSINYPNKDEAKKLLDEILMREGVIPPEKISAKYPDDEDMQKKVLVQELLNLAKNNQYKKILSVKKIYRTIPNYIAQRFGYANIDDILKEIEYKALEFFYIQKQCDKLLKSSKKVKFSITEKFFKTHLDDTKLLKCLKDTIDKDKFEYIYKFFGDSTNGDILILLETIAIDLKLFDRAYEISKKIDKIENKDILKKEFLNRFLIYSKLYNGLERFFFYVSKNIDFIKANEDNPMILDFYYEYYLYLSAKNNEDKAIEVLYKIKNLQKKFNVFVYSPFIEIELAKYSKLENDYKKALSFLKDGLLNAKYLKLDDKAKIYYNMGLIYKKLNKTERVLDISNRCKKIDINNLYKKMCIELNSN